MSRWDLASPCDLCGPRGEIFLFNEGVAKVTKNSLVYLEDASGRRVFISSRRYVEGERVDGLSLVKEIRPEAVLLSHQGEQGLLRLPGGAR